MEIDEQDSSNFMGSLDIDLLFTGIPLEEAIEICTYNLFKKNGIVHGLRKSESKDLSLATRGSYFIFDKILYKQIDGVAKSLIRVFTSQRIFVLPGTNRLDRCPKEYSPFYY